MAICWKPDNLKLQPCIQVQIADYIVFYLDVRRTHLSSELWTSPISNIDTTCWCGYLVGRFFLYCWCKEHPEAVSLLRIDTLWLTHHCKQDESVKVLPLGVSEVTTSEVTTDKSFYFLKEGLHFAFCENKIAGTLYSKHSQACSYTCESKILFNARTSEKTKGILSNMGVPYELPRKYKFRFCYHFSTRMFCNHSHSKELKTAIN